VIEAHSEPNRPPVDLPIMAQQTPHLGPSSQDLLDTASEGFQGVVAQVTEEHLALPTACPDWNVLELIGHVVSGSQMAAAVADGAQRNEAIGILATDFVGDDPLAAVREALANQRRALGADDIDTRICQHPAGDMPGSQLLGFRISDLLVHQWDLAQAIGVDTTLDPAAVQHVWDDISPMAPIIAQLGVFGDGPSGSLDVTAPLDVQLLDLMGRRPA